MTITIGTKTLNVREMNESMEVVAIFTDKWENEQYKRKVRVYGTIRTWTLSCFEDDVNYADSAFKYLQDQAKIGNVLSFVVDEGQAHQINTYVYIMSITLTHSPASTAVNHREFTIALQEAA
ncbi:MAG: hypothetical protein QXF43_04175 [Nitrososphaerales archaeon]